MKPLLTCLFILTSTFAASAQLTDPFTDGTPMGWRVDTASPVPPTGPLNLALAKEPVSVPAGGSWQTFNFSFAVADLMPRETGTVPTALKNGDTLRLPRSPSSIFGGPEGDVPGMLATMGVDNITAPTRTAPVAVTVPEPATYLGAFGLCALIVLNYLRRRFRPA